MNYYPFHIGDYLSATRHLTWEEDCAYRRLLDTYYVTEKALPADLRAVCRLVMAATEVQREAVEIVLKEFFILTETGWVNERADAEIDSMRLKQEANELRDEHERERMRRHRERRAKMFDALRKVEIVPPWDVSIKELQRLFSEHCNNQDSEDETQGNANESEPETHLKREQVVSGNAPETAIPTPTPTPIPKVNNKERAPRFDAQAHLVGLGIDPVIASDWIKLRKTKRAEVTATAIDGVSREADKAGMSLDAALRECCSRGWAGFKAEWVQARDSPGRVIQHQTVEQRNKAVTANWIPPEMRATA